ncbi:unnamed protein product (macronuclear) [Paramecium tetraurelia]|uniref:Tyrosine-protein phosphatase domain-containing protein n=1 Tax=Paramecium tetraurelia TaxID=5888 RepID=A0D217_PARTE|nr:uncharacterized protein GSPATT00012590001 [Paramecium tetraurelia]CAK77084.1 unnamed protein product [Paramecium tetraurelia]|eukprot:XP_001444481.1 hypothetical protein (macronuclear) [Paramecium tetraurelia strain d4-2]
MISSMILREDVPMYQKGIFCFYYMRTEYKRLHNKSVQIQPKSFSFVDNNVDYISIYESSIKQIDLQIQKSDVQINYSSDGLANAIVCAYFIDKKFDFDSALYVMTDCLGIDKPQVRYLNSLKRFEAQLNCEPILNRSSIILNSEMDLEKTIQNSIVQSEILNFPIFSQRLIETQRNSQILPSEYQATSEIYNQQPISFISFGQQELQNINEEPEINKIQSSIILNKKS